LAVSLIRRSSIVASLYPKWQPTDDAVHLTAALVSEMKSQCQRSGSARFVLVLLPQTTSHWTSSLASLEREIKADGVTTLNLDQQFSDYLEQHGNDRSEFFFPHDGHPNPKYTTLIAGWVSDYLQRQKNQQ
jgi:hypothetical protein